ncbi:MAG: PAS domain S-box protein, partial [Actinobacteria bacterium]|nr:PAS domain S-box protein [Actinomycetota bacterium]
MTSDAREDRSAVPVDGPGVPSGFESHLLDQVEAAVIATDLAGTIIHWNRRAEQLCGRPREDALGLAIVETAFPEADRARLDETMAEVRGGGRWDGELPVRRRDGASFPAFVTLSALRDADGHVAGVAGVFVDVTEQRRLREEVQRSRDQLDVILRGVADGITVQDPSGQLVFANDAAARAIGFSTAEELMATPVADVMRRFEVMDEDGNPLPLEELPGRRALKGETDVGRVLRFRVRATGEERWSMVKASPILGPDGSVPMALNIFHDITEAKLAEHAERFLGESSALLSSSLDLERTLTTLTTLAVPALADWCIVDMAQEDGSIRQLAVAHADPEKAELARELRRRYPP